MGQASYQETGRIALEQAIQGVHEVVSELFAADLVELLSVIPQEIEIPNRTEHNSALLDLFRVIGHYVTHEARIINKHNLLSKIRQALAPLENEYPQHNIEAAIDFMVANLAIMPIPDEPFSNYADDSYPAIDILSDDYPLL